MGGRGGAFSAREVLALWGDHRTSWSLRQSRNVQSMPSLGHHASPSWVDFCI